MTYRLAILDDYQNVALKLADWSSVKGDLDIKVFNHHLGGDEEVIKALRVSRSSRRCASTRASPGM